MLQQAPVKQCPSFSAIWLMAMNVLYFVLGVALMGMSSWGIQQQAADPETAILPAAALNVLVAAGVFLVLLAIAGCVGVQLNSKIGGRYLLGFYAFFMVLVMLMEFSAAIILFTFVGRLDSFSPASAFKDQAIYAMVNASFAECCCALRRCPGNSCWLPSTLPYPCDDISTFAMALTDYVESNIQPVAGVALFLCLLQLFTSITACCNQCAGVKQAEKDKIAGPMAYDGLYSEGEEAYAGSYDAYAGYVKSGAAPPRPGSAGAAAAAAGAVAPRAPGAAAAPPRGPPRGPPRPAAPAAK